MTWDGVAEEPKADEDNDAEYEILGVLGVFDLLEAGRIGAGNENA